MEQLSHLFAADKYNYFGVYKGVCVVSMYLLCFMPVKLFAVPCSRFRDPLFSVNCLPKANSRG